MIRFFLLIPIIASCLLAVFPRGLSAQQVDLKTLVSIQPEEEEDEKALSRFYYRLFEKEKEEERPEIGWFVGPMFFLMNYDSEPFEPMTGDRGLESFSDNSFLYGAMGGLIRKNLRFGGLILTGEQYRRERVSNDIRKARIYFIGGGAFVEWNREFKSRQDLNYPARLPYVREGYLAGLMMGMGRLELSAEGPDLGPKEEWRVREALYVAYPYVGLWMSPYYDWLWVQLDIGYLYFNLPNEGDEFVNAGVRMMEDDFTGGFQLGLKITFGDNPNIELGHVPQAPRPSVKR